MPTSNLLLPDISFNNKIGMGSYTKLNLLLITIVSMFLMSFDSGSIKTTAPSDTFDYSVNDLSSFPLASSSATYLNLITNLSVENAATVNPHFNDKFDKLKKKYRRSIHSYAGIKHPVRQIEQRLQYISSNETYSKPHFLSHLQHFLFRLTPF